MRKPLPPDLAEAVERFDRAVHDALDNLGELRSRLVAELEQRQDALDFVGKLAPGLPIDSIAAGIIDVPPRAAGSAIVRVSYAQQRAMHELTPFSLRAGRHRLVLFAFPDPEEQR